MEMRGKVCPVVHRKGDEGTQLLAFRHPSAGNQFVKGTVEGKEPLPVAASRELREESGLNLVAEPRHLVQALIGTPPIIWNFYAFEADSDLPWSWSHQTEHDFGHEFQFFWHPLTRNLDQSWHSTFHEALQIIRLYL